MKYVGIDVSQDHLDFALLNSEGDHVESAQVRNEERAITRLVKNWIKKGKLDLSQSLFCLEPTGHYSHLLLTVLVGLQAPVWLAHPMNIKQGMGMARGKSDEIDAVRIAQYARRFRDQARMFTADHLRMGKLKQLLMKRRQLVEGKVKLKIQLGNVNRHMHKDLRSSFNRFDKAQMRTIDRLIKKVEVMIEAEIKADPKVKRQYDLISSVPGVGPVLASNLLALTDAFTRFATPRQLACERPRSCVPDLSQPIPFRYERALQIRRGRCSVHHVRGRRLGGCVHATRVCGVPIGEPGVLPQEQRITDLRIRDHAQPCAPHRCGGEREPRGDHA
ncbi:MAG: transposase [Flavobacteriales bacterium]|nr:transposase [Flavobacteriales bacterium]